MDGIYCINCKSQDVKQLLNGNYFCLNCRNHFSSVDFKMQLVEKIHQQEEFQLKGNICGRCGKLLVTNDWCSWCGETPSNPEVESQELQKQVKVIDAIILRGEPESYRKARLGDLKEIEQIYRSGDWISLIDLDGAAVEFLIGKLDNSAVEREKAIKALLEIGDERMFEPIIRCAKGHTDLAWKVLQEREIPTGLFGLMLDKLQQEYEPTSFTFKLTGTANAFLLEKLIDLIRNQGPEIIKEELKKASTIKDVKLHLVEYAHPGPHYLSDVDRNYILEILDCSQLREAARNELQRREQD